MEERGFKIYWNFLGNDVYVQRNWDCMLKN